MGREKRRGNSKLLLAAKRALLPIGGETKQKHHFPNAKKISVIKEIKSITPTKAASN